VRISIGSCHQIFTQKRQLRHVSAKFIIRRTACARAQFSGCSSTTNAHSETGKMAVCCQNLTLGVLSSRSALSVLVGALFKKFSLFLNTPPTKHELHVQVRYCLVFHVICQYCHYITHATGNTTTNKVTILTPVIFNRYAFLRPITETNILSRISTTRTNQARHIVSKEIHQHFRVFVYRYYYYFLDKT
jgi:hypothetical protein